EPIDDVGDKLAPAPPRRPRIASPEMREHREHERQRDRHRHHLFDGLAKHQHDFKGKTGHSRLSNPTDSSRTPVLLRSREARRAERRCPCKYTRSKPSSNCRNSLKAKFTLRTNS